MLDDALDELFGGVIPDHPLVHYALPAAVLAAWLATAGSPFPSIALGAGVLASGGLYAAYEFTGLRREGSGGERSTADRIALGLFGLVVAGGVLVAEADAIAVPVSATQALGALTGLLAGACAVEWLLPALAGARS